MALYNVTSSGNLNFADTGLGNPVSFFAYNGLSTNALAGSPIGGDNSQIWLIPNQNTFTSSGSLVFVNVNLSTQSGLAASAIGEFPISGILDNIPETRVSLGFVTSAQTSSGNLVISGSTSSTLAYNKESAGNLVISGSSVYSSERQFQSSGNLLISGNTVTLSLRNAATAGNLLISATDAYNIVLTPTTSGNLIISGTDFVQKVYNKTSAGNLLVNGATVTQTTVTKSTHGNLVVTDIAIQNTLYTGGLAANPVASFPIAAGSESVTVQQVVVSFYGDVASQGNLEITSTGEFVNSISESGVIAGAALADQTIGGGMDTVYQSTGYQTILNDSSSGNLLISGSTGINNDRQSSGNLLITGSSDQNRTTAEDTAGNLIVSGTTEQSSLRNLSTAGNLVITPFGEYTQPLSSSSGIAGAALADQTIGGGKDTNYIPSQYQDLWIITSDGNLLISGSTGFINDYTSTGNLIVSGNTVVTKTLNFSSSGNLEITSSSYQNRTIAETTSGNLLIFSTITQPLSSSSGIAGAALADQAIAGGKDTNSTEFQDLWVESTNGNLAISSESQYNFIRNKLSTGNLLINGSTEQNSIRNKVTSGNLVISGTTVFNRTLDFNSSGALSFTAVGFQASSTNSGSIAGSSIAEIPIAGVLDNNTVIVVVSYISGGVWYDGSIAYATSAGNLVISGSSGLNNDQQSSGNLEISGTTIAEYVPAGAISTGELIISGSTTVQFIPAPAVTKGGGGGGSPVFASSWDALTPYFPDDRHILGYQQGNVEHGNLQIRGHATIAFVSGQQLLKSAQAAQFTRKSLSDFMRDVEQIMTVMPAKSLKDQMRKQAVLEDQLLLSGRLLDFDPIQDELDSELNM